MFENWLITLGWFGSQQIIQICLIRYLVLLEVPALYAALFFVRLWSIFVFLIVIVYQILKLEHPKLNSPYFLGQPFRFNLGLIFLCSLFECVTIAMSIHALAYYNIIHFMALFQIFRAFFRSWINNVTPATIFWSFCLMGLTYLLEDWITVIPGNSFTNRLLSIKKTFEWQPLVMVIAASASKTFGIWIFKIIQMKIHQNQKSFNDRISWANYIADEPDKITHNLCVVNSLFSRYLEAQLQIHCEQNSMTVENLSQKEFRQLIDSYFENKLSYSFAHMEQYKIFEFNNEAVDDPELYKQEDTLFRRMIKEKIFQIQLQHQQFKDLFGSDKYLNLQFEILYEDYGIHEYIWDAETPQIQLFLSFFEGLFCFLASFLNGEHTYNYFRTGFDLYHYIGQIQYYTWISLFLGILYIGKLYSYKLMFLWNVQTYFFTGLFCELIVVYLAMIWIEQVDYIQMLGLIISYCIMAILYRSAEKVRDQKTKLFYLSYIAFLIRVQKFTIREGSQIIQMMALCAEKLSLNEFLKIMSQILCCHGIISYDQLRHIKFSHFGESPFFNYQIPFLFQSQLRYENNIESHCLLEEQVSEEKDQKTKFERYIIQSKYQENKSTIKSQLNQNRQLHQSKIRIFNNSNLVESKIVQMDESQKQGNQYSQINKQQQQPKQ